MLHEEKVENICMLTRTKQCNCRGAGGVCDLSVESKFATCNFAKESIPDGPKG